MSRYFKGIMLVAGALLMLSASAQAASLAYVGSTTLDQSPAATVASLLPWAAFTTEWGTVEAAAAGDSIRGSNPDADNRTWSRSELESTLGPLSESDFRLLMTVNETPADPALRIQRLTLRFYTDESDFSQFFDAVFTPATGKTQDFADLDLDASDLDGHAFLVNFDNPVQFSSWTRVGFLVQIPRYASKAHDGRDLFSIIRSTIIPVPATVQLGGMLLAGIMAWKVLQRRAHGAD